MRLQRGVTLIELMIVVAILVILVGVGYPLYTSQVEKARRAEAKMVANGLALAEERYFTRNGRYGSIGDLAGEYTRVIRDFDLDSSGQPDNYEVTIRLPAQNTAFTITLDAQGKQASDTDCAQYTIDSQGLRVATNSGGTANPKCWK